MKIVGLPHQGLGLFLLAVCILAGCEKNSGKPIPQAQTQSQTLPRVAAPPIAPPQGGTPHAGLPEEIRPHPTADRVMQEINRYKQRLEANPNDLEALIVLGNANFDIQRFEMAKDLYLRALALDPQNVIVRTDLASCYRNLGDIEKAFQELDKVLAINSQHETALYNLGVLLLNDRQDIAGAIQTWEKLIATHPTLAYATDLRQRIEELKVQSDSAVTGTP